MVRSVVVTANTTPIALVSNTRPGQAASFDESNIRIMVRVDPTLLSTLTAYLGGADVTVNNGFPIRAADPAMTVEVEPGEELYVVAASAVAVKTLRVGR